MSDDEVREAEQLEGVRLPEFASGVVGHAAAQASVAEQLAARRLPGGVLIHGPLGIGKATFAFDVARKVLTATGDEDEHRVAEQVASGGHPNLFVLRRQARDTGKGFYTVIRVDEIRALRERMRRTRGRAGHRVAIIDSIDDCNPQAANALLKTLEEPPDETVFLLVSHRPGSLLPTIKSRCHALALRPLSDADVGTVLAGQQPDADLDAAIVLAEGRPRRGFEALAMPDQGLLIALERWLSAPDALPAAAHLMIADQVAAAKDGPEAAFARDIVRDFLAAEARDAAISENRPRLASANALWEKATAQFADADEYNLDARQTLIGIFDAIRRHRQHFALAAEQR